MASKQLAFIQKIETQYGGDLLTTRKARSAGRPLDTKNSMHLVLRSTKARGPWSFLKEPNRKAIREILLRFSKKYGIRIQSIANVGNHLHLQIRLSNRRNYTPFIKAVTAAIAMAITGVNRWTQNSGEKLKFWDRRPFTRVIFGFTGILSLRNYIRLNQLEGIGIPRHLGRKMLSFKARLASQSRRFAFPETS